MNLETNYPSNRLISSGQVVEFWQEGKKVYQGSVSLQLLEVWDATFGKVRQIKADDSKKNVTKKSVIDIMSRQDTSPLFFRQV